MKTRGTFGTIISILAVSVLLLVGCGCPTATTTPASTITTPEEKVEVFTPSASAVFGETFVQEKDSKVTYNRTFSSEPAEGTIYVLYSDADAPQSGSIASVTFNGQQIAELDDFDQQLRMAILPVDLKETNDLQIGLTLSPEGVTSMAVLPLDTVPPLAPVLPVTRYSTSEASQVITGTAEANSLVTVTGGAFLTQQELDNGDAAFSIPVPLRWNEVNTLLVTATDAAGNVSLPIEVNVEQTGETGTAILTGKVMDAETERGIQAAEVKVAGTFSASTDADGSYTISNLPEGSAAVSVSAPGFVGNVQRVSLEAGQTIWQDIALAGVAPATVIGPGGGIVHGTDGTTLEIPPGALDSETALTVSPIHTSALPAAPGIGTKFLGMTDLGPSGTWFNVPVTFTFSLTVSLPAGTEFDVISFNPDTGAFQYLNATANADGTTASVQLDRIEGGEVSLLGILKVWGNIDRYTYTQATSIEGGSCDAETELSGEVTFAPEFMVNTIGVPGVSMTAVTLVSLLGAVAPDQTRPISATVRQGYTGKLYARMTIEDFQAGASLNLFFFTIELGNVKAKGMIEAEGVIGDETQLDCGWQTISFEDKEWGITLSFDIPDDWLATGPVQQLGEYVISGWYDSRYPKPPNPDAVWVFWTASSPPGGEFAYSASAFPGQKMTGKNQVQGRWEVRLVCLAPEENFDQHSRVLNSITESLKVVEMPMTGIGTISVGVICEISHATWRFEGPLSTAYIGNPENALVTISGTAGERTQRVDEQGGVTFTDLPVGNYKVTASARWYGSQTEETSVYPGCNFSILLRLHRETGIIRGGVLCGGRGVGVPGIGLDVSFTPTGERASYQLSPGVSFDPTDTENASYWVSSAGDGSYSQEVDAGRYFIFVRYTHMFSCDSYNETTPSLLVEPGDTVTHDIILMPLMWVASTQTGVETRQEGTIDYVRALARVEVWDWLGPLSGVEVYGHWSGDYSDSVSGTTDGEGCVTFTTDDWVEEESDDTFTFTVDGLEKTDWEYDEEGSQISSTFP